jgi:hypothetical protein
MKKMIIAILPLLFGCSDKVPNITTVNELVGKNEHKYKIVAESSYIQTESVIVLIERLNSQEALVSVNSKNPEKDTYISHCTNTISPIEFINFQWLRSYRVLNRKGKTKCILSNGEVISF